MAKTRDELEDLAENFNIIDNDTQEIEPTEVRDQYKQERDSTLNKIDDGLEVSDVSGRKALVYSAPQTVNELDNDGLVTKSNATELSSDAINTHVSQSDPHTQYLTDSRGDLKYYSKSEIDVQQGLQDVTISNNQIDIATNVTNISANSTQISNNSIQIGNNITEINNNATNISTNSNDISNNSVNIGANSLNISQNTSDISQNSSDISTNVTNISSNQLDISDNTTQINTNTSNISSNSFGIMTNAMGVSSNSSSISAIESEQITQNNAIALNTSKISADGSVNTHNDVDLTGVTTFQNSIMKYDGANYIPCLNILIDAPTLIINSSDVLIDVVNTDIDIQRLTPHKITISYGWSLNDQRENFESFATFGGANIAQGLSDNSSIHIQEPKDVQGTDPDGRGTDQKHRFSSVFTVTPNSLGNNAFILQFSGSANGDLASIWDVKIEIEEYININVL